MGIQPTRVDGETLRHIPRRMTETSAKDFTLLPTYILLLHKQSVATTMVDNTRSDRGADFLEKNLFI